MEEAKGELFIQVRITRACLCAKNDPVERGRLVIKKKKKKKECL